MSDRKTDTTMTDPVDTDALRGKAKVLWKRGAILRGFGDESDLQDADIDQDVSRMLRATADEVYRLRADLGTQERVNADIKRAADAFLEESEHLRAVIENAPHGANCNCSTYRVEGVVQTVGCTCWKASAL